MASFYEILDELADTREASGLSLYLGRTAFVFLILMVIAAPHSIAATQTAWICGMLAMLGRRLAGHRSRSRSHVIVWLLWAFFGWSVISGVMSYEPLVSLDRLRGVSLFLIVIFVLNVVRTRSAAHFLAFALIFSCMVNVLMVPIQRLIGRGVEIAQVAPDGPLAKVDIRSGDTLLKVNGKKIAAPDDIVSALRDAETAVVAFHRSDWYSSAQVKRSDLLTGETSAAQLGIGSYGPSHYWRVMGFYNHYTTYAEVLQLIMSLTFGLLIAGVRFLRGRAKDTDKPEIAAPWILRSFGEAVSSPYFLFFAMAAMTLAMFLTVTRASQLSFMISALVIAALILPRKVLLTAALVAIPIAALGVYALQNARQVGFFDTGDESTQYRMTMWTDGVRIASSSARNAVFGVGMDSVQTHWREWGMYKGGQLAMGHFHSTPIQLLVERGLPALLLWAAVLIAYAMSLWRGIRLTQKTDWRTLGILAGCFGGAVGFVSSGMVHWNLGDSEVAMVFYLLMGLSLKTAVLGLSPTTLKNDVSAGHTTSG